MQMLLRNTTTDPAAWRGVFDADAEARGTAGLSLLQLWHAAGDPNTLWALFEVSDLRSAQAWLDAPQGPMHATRAAVVDSEAHFVETA